ncbi:competence/damage-inducible protein A [Aneurinibacillus aneurinilyticus]|uniref:Putative competence-damage inducible protein n=1 Tax=Aneurinibacillus aneurinilyticus ATCC 12856 TaxID=649747 RepID=U1X1B1_ANEAE|nr:competence/damage-inducible protein A [Aneurinibacillus aneurinilyticus]ERI08293.1 competence/damage-inducible protein CinA domain protein [Aneurinibacillus aneurinilyticus ATCC 12856]MED0705708.1 competence/damage-inducible protein A [Aneurinibacillus aneurinilyticus]MED0725823.1 competence/damage-inducible protein A [Aneurinibacillus aneurinilyticus]MED0732170.1 competence/damage-inducible protein A [Aneurinibacillus aneurinilyticus]MED0740744.1 competence/damage-inducible protein A [Aneu
MKAEIIAVGTELLLGQIANTNAQFLSQKLAEVGIGVYYHTVVGDNADRLYRLIEEAFTRSDLIIFSGGLGPTKDDLTKETVARAVHRPLVHDETALDHIVAYFDRRGIKMTENNRKQALVVEGSKVLPNDHGMAPGMVIEHKGKYLMMLPGPPRELYPMFTTYGLPHLLSLISDQYVVHSKVLRFFGIGESALEEELMDLIDAQSNPTIAPLAKEGEVTLRLTAKAKHISEAEEMIQVIEQKIEGRVGEFIYGYDDDSLESVLVRELIGQKKTVAFAESITGGLVSHMVTSVPGSSAMLKGSIVCYTNDVKHHLLAVPKDILTQAGAVSEETAHILAEEVRLRLGSTYGVSITGEAGPVASEDKPVGLVYIGVADGTQTQVKTFRLSGQRSAIQSRAAKHAIFTMLERIKKGGF